MEHSRQDLMQLLGLKHNPTMEEKFIEMTNPDSPSSSNQKYRLTKKGEMLKKFLNKG